MDIVVETNRENQAGSDGKPVMLAPIYANIPQEMRDRRQWIDWKLSRNPRPTGKPWTKIPLDPNTGRKAATTRPETWADFGTARDRHEQLSRHAGKGGSEGLGYILRGDHVGIDLDDCRDPHTGELEPWAQEIIRRIDSYTEVSPSGSGIRIICRGKLPPVRTPQRQGRDVRRKQPPLPHHHGSRSSTVVARSTTGRRRSKWYTPSTSARR